ncbi:MAG: hypothetical protein QOF78_1588 [Phycisphaerales bacterium]|nr:hypothetical protein [Phycisphaerales bacterium]
MLQDHQIDDLIALVSALDRASLLAHFQSYRASFPVDFTQEFLAAMPIDRLRHVFVALCLQTQRLPTDSAPAAA